MKKLLPFFISAILILSVVSCGKKGSLLPPLVKMPQPPQEVKALQRGDRILLTWKNPQSYKDGSPLPGISEVEVWLLIEKDGGEKGKKTVSIKEFEKTAERIALLTKEKFPEHRLQKESEMPQFLFSHLLQKKDLIQKNHVFGLKVKDLKGRDSEFSGLTAVIPKRLPLPPTDVKVSLREASVDIEWSPPQKNIDNSSSLNVKGYNIYRSEGERVAKRINSALVEEAKYEDSDFQFGVKYIYFIRASIVDSPPFLESNDSEVAEILTKDTFAPDPPSGLMAVSGRGLIALSWERSQDKDFAGYLVWRREEGEDEFKLMTPVPLQESMYTDTDVEKNKRYYYAITALDTAGNESLKSESGSEIVEDFPS